MNKKTAFVLSGGGAKGCFQVGVMKQLIKDKGILPNRIYGTSTGALQASGYVHLGIDRLEQQWLSIKSKSDVMSRNWFQYLSLGIFMDGIYNMKPLKKRLEAIESENREPGINCEAVVTKVNLETGELKYCYYDDLDFLESVVASCSVPVLNSPYKGWVDGGVRDQTPILGAVKDGFDKIICIINNPIRINPTPWKFSKFLSIPKILIRVADDIQSGEVWLDEIRHIQNYIKMGVDIEVYMPDKLLLDTQDYNPVKIRAGIEQGYKAEPVDLKNISLF